MRAYIKTNPEANLAYIVLRDDVHTQPSLVECALRPDENHTLTDSWQDDPMNPSVCWRPKTAQELDAEKDDEASRQIDETKLVKAVALWAAGHLGIAPAQARQEIKDIYKGL